MRIPKLLTVFLFGTLLTFSCSNPQTEFHPTKINRGFLNYISAYTTGVISTRSTISIVLSEAVPEIKPGDSIEEEVFSFSPKIEGKGVWINNRTIEFHPKEPLKQGTEYNAKLKLSKLIQVPAEFKTFKFNFQTFKQAVFVYVDAPVAVSLAELTKQQISGKVLTSDYANPGKAEKVLNATQDGKVLPLTWQHSENGKTHEFTIQDVSRNENASSVVVKWNGRPIGVDENDKIEIEIPALGDFKIAKVQMKKGVEQAVDVYFSDPIDSKQDLKGLIYFDKDKEPDFEINENVVTLYSKNKLKGKVKVIITHGVRNAMGYKLAETKTYKVFFTSIKPAVSPLGDGVIIPPSAGLIFPFKAVSLNAVNVKVIKIYEENVHQFLQINQLDGDNQVKRVGRLVFKGEIRLQSEKAINFSEWNKFSLDLSAYFEAEPGAIYRVNISFDKSQSLYPCAGEEIENGTNTFDAAVIDGFEKEESSYDSPDYYDYYYDYGYYHNDYNWKERDNPCTNSYYYNSSHFLTQNILSSNLGIIAKGGDNNKLIVSVNDINSANPLSGIEVEVYNYQNQLLYVNHTDESGRTTINLDKKPFLLVAKQGKERGYLRLDNGSSLSMSMFNVGGRKNKKGVKGFIYGERGVWRPGDTLFLSFVLEDKNRALPAEHPVIFELYTPENQLYQRLVSTRGLNGFYIFRTRTDSDAPTGNWLAKVKVGGSSFTKTIRIEAVKPNRLKIDLDFGSDILHSNDNNIRGNLSAHWLHGAIAGNLKTKVELTLMKGRTGFQGYEDFVFDDPSKDFYEQSSDVFDGQLNFEGVASFNPDIPKINNAPGMLKARFNVRVFENGGNASIDRFDIPYSPYSSYVGLKLPKGGGWMGALYSNEPNLIRIASVDEKGNPVDRRKIKIEIYDVRWRYWWENDGNSLGQFVSNQGKYLVKTDYINTKNGEAIYELNFNQNLWGRKLIRITDPISGHSSGQTFYVEYKGYWNSDGTTNPGGAEMLPFTTDKSKYTVGETVKVELPNSRKGRAWISIESGSKIVDNFWVNMQKGKQEITFKTTREMTPNVYVNISFIQPYDQTVNDMPIRMYGVQPIMVIDESTKLNPHINMKKELRPEEDFMVEVSEKDGKEMTYTLAVVDDGLLDLTHFKTPDPWSVFYSREALGIRTWDMYKYVLGAFSGKMAGLLAVGGDEFIKPSDNKKANRFKPVVRFIGPFELKKGETNTHKINMPNYVGSVRTMVVAGNRGAYGSVQVNSKVKKPLMVLATMPRVIGPGETLDLPVTVFAMNKNIKDVEVRVTTNEMIQVVSSAAQNLNFSKIGDKTIDFKLKIPEKLGIGKVHVVINSGVESASFDVEIDVRMPNPPIHKIIDGVIESNKSWSNTFEQIGIERTNKNVLEVSSTPPLNLESRIKYLISYPHGCIEQTVSSSFPQLYLGRFTKIDNSQKEQIDRNILASLNRIKKFQTATGGFTYWPGELTEANDWGTNYAGDFMLRAKAKGYKLPVGMLNGWKRYQRGRANSWNRSSVDHFFVAQAELTQAYRLYTLALAGDPLLSAMNRMRENTKTAKSAMLRLAAAYQLAGKPEIAKGIVAKTRYENPSYTRSAYAYTYGSSLRDDAMVLETYALVGDKLNGKEFFDKIVQKMGSRNWYSTQTTAFSLIAISEFIGGDDLKSEVNFSYQLDNDKTISVNEEKLLATVNLPSTGLSHSVKIKNPMNQTLFVRLYQEGIPLIDNSLDESKKLSFSVTYLDMNGNSINPVRLNQGTDFMVKVRVTNPDNFQSIKDMALTQIFPSGWEIRNPRMEAIGNNYSTIPRYQDIRDDRVYTYFDLGKGESKTFIIMLNASYAGRFYLPSVFCSAMYDNNIYGRIGGKWVEVTRD